MIIEKQPHKSNVLKVLLQPAYQRMKSSKRYIPALDCQYISPKRYIHLNVSQLSKIKQPNQRNKSFIPESEIRRYQQSFDCFSRNNQQKINKNKANLMAKYRFQRNGEIKKPSDIRSNEDRRPINNESMSLLLKPKHQSELPIKSLKEDKRQPVNCIPNQKPILFTMNRKQLRKCKMGQKKTNYLNYRVINLFDSLKQKINTIRQQQSNTIMGMNIKEYLEKIGKSCWKLTEAVKSTHQTIHTETPSSKGGTFNNQSRHNYIQEINETVFIHPINKKNQAKQRCHIRQEKKQFQLKPWSTQQIAIV